MRKLWLSVPRDEKYCKVPNTECELSTTEIVQRKCNISTAMEDIDSILTRLGILSSLFGQPIETIRPALVKASPGQILYLAKADYLLLAT